MKLIKTSKLNRQELIAAKALVSLSALDDGFDTKFYWVASGNRQNSEFSEYLFYSNDVLVGYLTLYQFADDEVEVCVVVHPEHRCQGVFDRLWVEATLELHQRNVSRVIFLQHPDSVSGAACLKSLEARYFRSEYRYECDHMKDINVRGLVLREVVKADLHVIARMDVACFGGEYSVIMARLKRSFKDSARTIYVAEAEGSVIGKAHVLRGDDIVIHDLVVMPAFQKQGWGVVILNGLTKHLLEGGAATVSVESTSDDYKANKLYTAAGFNHVTTYRQWLYNMQDSFEHYATLH